MKRPKINEKEAGVGPFKKIYGRSNRSFEESVPYLFDGINRGAILVPTIIAKICAIFVTKCSDEFFVDQCQCLVS